MRVAIVKLSALGDIVHAMVALQCIKEYARDIRIDWVVDSNFAGLLENNPDVDNILTVNLKALKKGQARFFEELRRIRHYAQNDYHLVIDAQGLLKSAIVSRLIGRNVAGFDAHSIREKAAAWFYQHHYACAYDTNTIDRNALILSRPLGLGISHECILKKKPFLFFRDEDEVVGQCLSQNRPNIVLVIGSTWETRNYPVEKYLKIADSLRENCLVIWGSEQERAKAQWLESQSKYVKALPKRLDLNSLKALIAKCSLLIGNDTGPTHMAWALNRPSITIFGPTPVSRVYQTEINKVVKSHSIVNPYKLNKLDDSIKDIDENEIIELARSLLSSSD